MATKFGDLVKAKLIERKMSASLLAQLIGKSRSYMTYVISGKNPSARRRKFVPGPDVVMAIAKVLEIAIEQAFEAAEMPVPRPIEALADAQHAKHDAASVAARPADDDQRLLEIATRGALEAIRQNRGRRAKGAEKSVTIDISDRIRVVLHDFDDMSQGEIERYKQEIAEACERVRCEIAEARTK